MTVPATTPTPGELMESVLIQGDLAKLTPQQRADYYMRVCESIGLNPLTQPLEYLNLKGKLKLYATKGCTDQLRDLRGISLKLISQDVVNDILKVHAQATLRKDGVERSDEDIGAVAFPATLAGEARADAEMKAVTKAKRRVTLSICGLGFLDVPDDETPLGAKPPTAAPNVMRSPALPSSPAETAELPPRDPPLAAAAEAGTPGARPAGVPDLSQIDAMAREAAERGVTVFNGYYKTLTPSQQAALLPLQPELRRLMERANKEKTK